MPFKALVVDDDATHRAHLKLILGQLGAEVTDASDKLGARTALLEKTFDLVVLNTNFPEMPGKEALKDIRKSRGENLRTAFIAFAEDVTPEELRAHMGAGFCTLLPKPVEAWRFREIVYGLGLASMPVGDTAASIETLAALADPLHLQIFGTIASKGEVTQTKLAEALLGSRQRFIPHLKTLQAAGLLRQRELGREVLYSVRTGPLEAAAHWLLKVAGNPEAHASPQNATSVGQNAE